MINKSNKVTEFQRQLAVLEDANLLKEMKLANIKVEKIDETCKWICKTFDIQEQVPLEHRNTSIGVKSYNSVIKKSTDYRSIYTEKTKKLVAKRFEIDIDTFKYTF